MIRRLRRGLVGLLGRGEEWAFHATCWMVLFWVYIDGRAFWSCLPNVSMYCVCYIQQYILQNAETPC